MRCWIGSSTDDLVGTDPRPDGRRMSGWCPWWTEPSPDEWRAQQQLLVDGDRWVIDGNYGRTFDVRFAAADTVIVLAPSRLRCVVGAMRRVVANHGRAIQAPGCPERLDFRFVRWIWRYPVDSRTLLDNALSRYPGRLRVIELRSRREATELLDQL